MNIIQLHDKVLGFIDQARSGRIHPTMIDSAINTVHITLLNQRIGTESVVGPGVHYPEESFRLTDAMKYYYKETAPIPVVDSPAKVDVRALLAGSGYPPAHLFLNIEINVGSASSPTWKTPTPFAKKDTTETTQNTFTKPRGGDWMVIYFSYHGGWVDFHLPAGLKYCQVRVAYYRFPTLVSHGILVAKEDIKSSMSNLIITSPRVLYGTNTVAFRGETFNVVDYTKLVEGEFCKNYAIVDIDDQMIEPLVAAAAQLITSMRIGVLNETKES